jgi:tight adherence protein B
MSMSIRLGVPLAGVLLRLARTVDDDISLVRQHAAATAGARVSALVLTVLPAVGAALGIGIGANPVPVLLGTGIGGVLLVSGVALSCAGLLWSARIAR